MKAHTLTFTAPDGALMRIVCEEAPDNMIVLAPHLAPPSDSTTSDDPSYRVPTNIRVEMQGPDGSWGGCLMVVNHSFIMGVLAHALAVGSADGRPDQIKIGLRDAGVLE